MFIKAQLDGIKIQTGTLGFEVSLHGDPQESGESLPPSVYSDTSVLPCSEQGLWQCSKP